MAAADEFNKRTSELVADAVSDPVLQSSTTLKVEKALTAARRIQGEVELIEREALKRNAHLPRLCWRRRRSDQVTEMPLTQSDSSRTISCAGFLPIGVGSVLRRHVGQFGVGAYIQEAIGHTKAESTCLG